MAEEFVEQIAIWRDAVDIGEGPLLVDDIDIDAEFELEATVKLVEIKKSVQNAVHNRHEYFFKIINLTKLERQGE